MCVSRLGPQSRLQPLAFGPRAFPSLQIKPNLTQDACSVPTGLRLTNEKARAEIRVRVDAERRESALRRAKLETDTERHILRFHRK